MAHGTKEVRTHVESEHIDKHGETKAFSKLQHIVIDSQTEMSSYDSHEKDESDSQ